MFQGFSTGVSVRHLETLPGMAHTSLVKLCWPYAAAMSCSRAAPSASFRTAPMLWSGSRFPFRGVGDGGILYNACPGYTRRDTKAEKERRCGSKPSSSL